MFVRLKRLAPSAIAAMMLLPFSALSASSAWVDDKPASKESDDKDKKDEAKKDSEPTTAAEAIKLGLSAAQKNDMAKAEGCFAKAVKLDPKSRTGLAYLTRARMSLASAAEGKKQYALFIEAAKAIRQLKAAYPELNPQEAAMFGVCVYNEACAYAVDKESEKAMASLKEAFAGGFDQLDQLDKDDDLASLRKLPGFDAFKKELLAKAAAASKAKIETMFKENKAFPFDFELKNLDDKPVKLADFKGKVTIVDVWGTWCPPCRMEIPHFVDLHAKYKAQGLAIVGINYEGGDNAKDDVKKIKAFVKENKIPYDCVIGDKETQAKIPNFEGYPTTLFLDRTGKVRLKLVGYTPMPELEAIIKHLLAEEGGPTASR